MYNILFTKQAQKDAQNIQRSGLKSQVDKIIETVIKNPFEPTQGFEKLKGNLKDLYSRRINKQHRFVYEISDDERERVVKVVSMWSHYEM